MTAITKDQLGLIAKAIVKVADPVSVILFGSRSRGTANKNSDIDLLVVGERPDTKTWSRRRTIGNIRRSLPALGVPIDILFYTPDEVLRWKETTNHIISEALNEGTVLYERS